MTLRTTTFDDSIYKLVPIKPCEASLERLQESGWANSRAGIWKAVIAAAPEYQGTEFLRRPITSKELNDPEYMAAYIESMDEDFNVCTKRISDLENTFRMLAHRAKHFPDYSIGTHIPEVFEIIGEDQPLANIIRKATDNLKM